MSTHNIDTWELRWRAERLESRAVDTRSEDDKFILFTIAALARAVAAITDGLIEGRWR